MSVVPFTLKERALFNQVSALYGEFTDLEKQGDSHPSDAQDMVDGIHKLQDILVKRAARRAWPDGLSRFQKVNGRFVQLANEE